MSDLNAFDLGEFTPEDVLGPIPQTDQMDAVETRLTSTLEQRSESIRWMLKEMQAKNRQMARALIHWSRHEPSILELTASIEHIAGDPIYLERDVIEYTTKGVELKESPDQRIRQLMEEVAQMDESDAL